MRAKYALLLMLQLLWMGLSPTVLAVEVVPSLREQQLLKEFRCVTCPNQSIYESMTPFAMEIRKTVHALVQANHSDAVIRAALRQQYGRKISYRPPFDPQTYLLWLGPAAIVLFLVIMLRRYIRL